MGSPEPIHVDDLETYLRCPAKYWFEYETPLEGDREEATASRTDLFRSVVCAALREAMDTGTDLSGAAVEAFDATWPEYADAVDHHSRHQRDHERRLLREGVLDACREHVDPDAVEAAREAFDRPVVGPTLPLEVASTDGTRYRIDCDYLRVDGRRADVVRLVDSLGSIGLTWPGMDVYEKHFQEGQFRPGAVARLFETHLAERWLEAAVDDAGCRAGTLQYGAVIERHFRAGESVSAESEWRAMNTHYDCHPSDVREKLRAVTGHLEDDVFDPERVLAADGLGSHGFDDVVRSECDRCAYRPGCEKRAAQEVRFDE